MPRALSVGASSVSGVDGGIGELFASASERMLARHVTDAPGSMLRAPAITTRGRVYAFATKANVIVKLPEHRVKELIGSGVGLPCVTGKAPLRQWVCLVPGDEDECLAYFAEARTFVAAF